MAKKQKRKTLPKDLKEFVESNRWKFAWSFRKSWPHWYLVREKVNDDAMFTRFVKFLRSNGYLGRYYQREQRYFRCKDISINGRDKSTQVFWEMETKTPEDTVIINVCPEEKTYEAREKAGTLPHQLSMKARAKKKAEAEKAKAKTGKTKKK